jgi:hypothetical protein
VNGPFRTHRLQFILDTWVTLLNQKDSLLVRIFLSLQRERFPWTTGQHPHQHRQPVRRGYNGLSDAPAGSGYASAAFQTPVEPEVFGIPLPVSTSKSHALPTTSENQEMTGSTICRDNASSDYDAVPGSAERLSKIRRALAETWQKALRSCSQKGNRLKWDKFSNIADLWIPKVRIVHLHPWQRLRL